MTATLFPDLAPPSVPKTDAERYVRMAQAIILHRGLLDCDVGGDDVHTVFPPPAGIDPRTLGEAFHGLARAGIIAPARLAISNRGTRHSGLTRRWLVVDFSAACRYLEALRRAGDDPTVTREEATHGQS